MNKKNTMAINWVSPNEIKPYDNNPRINDHAVDKVANSLKDFGWQQPIVVDQDKTIIVGHTRWKAANKLGMEQIPILVALDLTEAQVKAYRLADNRTGELAEWDFNLLPIELEDLKMMDFDMGDIGFSDIEIEQLFADKDPVKDGMTDPDNIPEPTETPKSELGMVYQCGNHRLICGDATSSEVVAQLLDGGLADLWLTDPPYNVDVSNSKGLKILNDNMAENKFNDFLAIAFGVACGAMKFGASFYIFHSDNYGLAFRQAVKLAGLTLRQNLIWAKNGFTLGRQDYQWAHEACLYGWRDGASHSWYNGRSQCTIIDIKGQPFTQRADGKYQLHIDNRYYVIEPDAVCIEENTTIVAQNKPLKCDLHPTMKPVELLIKLIKNSTQRGEVVFDNFGGSGSTMIACEQTARQARLIELDPHYCDVIRKRWAEFVHGEDCDWEGLTNEIN